MTFFTYPNGVTISDYTCNCQLIKLEISRSVCFIRDGCNIVNVGRAEIVDEKAIWREVSSGRLCYASDVWWREPGKAPQQSSQVSHGSQGSQGSFYGSEYPFHELDNVIVTPHMAGGPGLDGIEEERAEQLAETAYQALNGGLPPLDLSRGY